MAVSSPHDARSALPADMPCKPGDLAAFDQLTTDTLVVFWPAGVRPLRGAAGYLDWRMSGALSRAVESGSFSTDPNEVMLVPTAGRLGRRRVFVFGVGLPPQWELACRGACEVLAKAGARAVSVVAPVGPGADLEAPFLRAFAPAARAAGVNVAEYLVDPTP